MRNTIKTFILLMAVIAAISGVLVYANTRVVLPKIPDAINQYKYDLSESVSFLSEKNEQEKTDLMFTIVKDRIEVFEMEGKITIKEKDESLNEFISFYTPLFINQSLSKFNRSDWSVNNHSKMLSRINELKAIKLSNNQRVVNSSQIVSFNLISKVINDYNHAVIIAKNTSYTTAVNAQLIINEAVKYAADQYLSNNTDLRNSLKSVSRKIGESHLNQLNNRINQLGNYRNFNQTHYLNTLVPSFDRLFKDYKENANTLYGGAFGTTTENNSLFEKASKLTEDALVYYSLN